MTCVCFSNKTKAQNLPLLLLENPRNKCEIDTPSSHIYTSQQIYFYVITKTIVYYHLRQCLRETRLSSQNKQ